MNVLLIDDDESVRESFLEWSSQEEFKVDINPIVALSVEDGLNSLAKDVDIAIVDMKFGADDSKGNEFIDVIQKNSARIPVFVYTGTPDAIEVKCFRRYIKDQKSINEILQECVVIGRMGLLNIMGHRGLMEEYLHKVFFNNLLESSKDSKWAEYALADSKRTEKALLRYTLNHLKCLLDDNDDEEFFPEEVYISLSDDNKLRTGSILKCKKNGTFMVVISPACDIAVHGEGGIKTERIQLLEIDATEETLKKFVKKRYSIEENENIKERLCRNAFCHFYHFFPQTNKFQGGFVNFRKIHSMKPRLINKYFDNIEILISESFCKDLVSRFSSYYARQGQPVLKMV